MIFTGTRWTTLVKLPVAFSGGSRLNSAPVAGARLATLPSMAIETSRCPGPRRTFMPGLTCASCVSLKLATHVELGAFGRLGDQLRAGRDMLAKLGGAVADDAVEGRADLRVGQVVLRHAHGGGGALLAGLGLVELGGQDLQLLLGRGQLGLGGDGAGIVLALLGDGLVVGLTGDGAGAHQFRGARSVGIGQHLPGLGLGDGGLGGGDGGALLHHLPRGGGDGGVGLVGGGLGLIEAGLPVARVEHDQRIAGVDVLVVGHGDRQHVTVDAGAEDGDVALDVGVVGGFQEAAFDDVPVAEDDRGDQDDTAEDVRQHPTEIEAPAGPALGRGDFGDRFVDDGVHGGSRCLNYTVQFNGGDVWAWGQAGSREN